MNFEIKSHIQQSYSYKQQQEKKEIHEEEPEDMLRKFMIESIKKIDGVIKMLDRKFPYLRK